MRLDLGNFIYSLARMMAEAAGLSIDAAPRSVWVNSAVEKVAADPYSVVRCYGGPAPDYLPLEEASVQVLTVGTRANVALNQARKLFEALLDDDGHPKLGWAMAGYKMLDDGSVAGDGSYTLIAVDPQQRQPGLIGTDDRGRHQAVFNFDVEFERG